ncbi:hypothetical protein S245_013197, partial [Arachis hypogaea]
VCVAKVFQPPLLLLLQHYTSAACTAAILASRRTRSPLSVEYHPYTWMQVQKMDNNSELAFGLISQFEFECCSYNPLKRREVCKGGREVPSVNAAASQVAKRPSSFGGPDHDEKLSIDRLEKEHDFYFAKLRDIEIPCQTPEIERLPCISLLINRGLAKIVPALIAGNSIVLKPPTQRAISALHMVHYFHLAGFSKGLINCVTGKGSEIGDFLIMHPDVNCINFTCGDTGIAISKKAMELGEKDACIVFEDADLDLGSLKLKDITVRAYRIDLFQVYNFVF